jgi:cytochrome c-type biogenesis protein CcmF
MGLGYQLILLVVLFAAIGLWLFVSRYKDVPDVMTMVSADEKPKKAEETIQSREFWMFLGALVLLFSAVLITGATSLPVFNKIVQLFNPDYVGAALKDPVEHHNRYQLWIAVFIGLLTGIGIFTRYNERNWRERSKIFGLHTGIAALLAGALTVLNRQWIEINAWQLYALLFSGMFALSANLDYLVTVAKGNIKMASAAISHVGFGALVLGILSTGLGKAWISTNKFVMRDVIEGAGEDELNKNVILLKGSSLPIRDFNATYLKDTVERQTRTFTVKFERRNENGNVSGESFELYPNVMYDRQFSKIVANNPSTKHYWDYDIFTMITSLPKAELDPEFARQQEDSLKYVPCFLSPGDTLRTENNILVLQGVTKTPNHHDYEAQEGDLALGLQFKAFDTEDTTTYLAEPMMYIRPSEGGFTNPAQVNPLELKIRLNEKTLQAVFDAEDKMKYTPFDLKEGDNFDYKGYQLAFTGVEKNVKHPSYSAQAGDIAVAAIVGIRAPDGKTGIARPVYLIRDNTPFSLKDDNTQTGLSFRFENIDPAKGVLTIGVADIPKNMAPIPFELAENVQRSDYVVLEAIIFPGINLVWAGSLLMLFGFALSLWRRWNELA